MKRKLKSRKGLSLVETLAVVVILLLLGLVLNAGLRMAAGNYFELTARSETQLLLSTAGDALADELRFADNVRLEGEDCIYDSRSFGMDSRLVVSDGQIYVRSSSGEGAGEELKRLLPPGAYRWGRYQVTELKIVYHEESACFDVVLEVGEAEGNIGAETAFTIRCLNMGKPGGGGI